MFIQMRKLIFSVLLFSGMQHHLSAQTAATELTAADGRGSATTPDTYYTNMKLHFKINSDVGLPFGGNSTLLGLRGHFQNAGGKAFELVFSDDNQVRVRSGYSPSWEAWRKFIIEDYNGNIVRDNGSMGIGTITPLEKLHIANGNVFIQSSYLGVGNSSGAILRLGAWNYSPWHAGLGVTQGPGVDVLDLDFYTVYQTPTIKMKLTAGGNLGIGTNTPLYKLHVNGQLGFADNSYVSGTNGYTQFFTPSNTAQPIKAGGLAITDDYTEASPLSGLYVKGNVGIGTTNTANYRLTVEGTIGTRKLKVTSSLNWADYVFDESYKLPSLNEVEAFIKQHKHLPDVPSAAEVKKEGLDVGDNQAVLLKKIEELTLYMIELKKEVTDQRKEISSLKQQLIN